MKFGAIELTNKGVILVISILVVVFGIIPTAMTLDMLDRHPYMFSDKNVIMVTPASMSFDKVESKNSTINVALVDRIWEIEGKECYRNCYELTTFDEEKYQVKTFTNDIIHSYDEIIFEETKLQKICGDAVNLTFLDGHNGMIFDINPNNFTESDIDQFYRDRYSIETNFKECDKIASEKKFYKNNELIGHYEGNIVFHDKEITWGTGWN